MTDEMPDFDAMTPEEMMRWMESLAKRQGASEGLTTDADIDIPEVDAEDERLRDLPEYKPYGMSDEEWAEIKAKEDAEKAEHLAQWRSERSQATAAPEPEPQPEPEPEPQPAPQATASGGWPTLPDGSPDVDNMTPEQMQEWMESLAKRQGGDTSGFITEARAEVGEVDENDPRLQGLPEYKPYGMSDEEWERRKAQDEAERQARLAQMNQAANQPPEPAAPDDLAALLGTEPAESDAINLPGSEPEPAAEGLFDALFGNETPPEEDDTAIPTSEQPAAENPLSWLEGLAENDKGTADLDLDLSGLDEAAEGLPDLSGLDFGEEMAEENPLSWLEGLAGDEPATDPLAGLTPPPPPAPEPPAASGPSDDVDPIEWMESLARDQGADTQELTTGANLNIPRPERANADTADPGYEPFSFEPGSDAESETALTGDDVDALDDDDATYDPAAWLEDLASVSGGGSADETDDDADPEQGQQLDAQFAEASRRGELTPDMVENYFKTAFQRADQRDIPDYIDPDDDDKAAAPVDEADEAIQPVIPDWLQQSMQTTAAEAESSAEEPASDADALMAELFGQDDEAEELAGLKLDEDNLEYTYEDDDEYEDYDEYDEVEPANDDLPDWLQPDADETDDSGDIMEDIFAQIADGTEEADTGEDELAPDVTTAAAGDPWIDALANENSESLANWYEQSIAKLAENEPQAPPSPEPEPEPEPEPIAPADDTWAVVASEVSDLQPASLAPEHDLPHGEAQAVPDWLISGTQPRHPFEVGRIDEATDNIAVAEIPDWLQTDEIHAVDSTDEMPDWLQQAQVDESIAEGDVPDWLAVEGGDVNVDDIPDWLLETIEDDDEPAVAFEPEPEPAPVAPVVETPPPAPQRPAAPVAPDVQNLDVAATLNAAREQVSAGNIDNGLVAYEQIIRANQQLDTVVTDLRAIMQQSEHKEVPALYRVLGDGLMRQGHLQEALDTYRKALNLL